MRPFADLAVRNRYLCAYRIARLNNLITAGECGRRRPSAGPDFDVDGIANESPQQGIVPKLDS
jgi:hypothetical protein